MVLDFLANIPSEVSLSILKNLDIPDLARCERVSKRWNTLADDSWRDLAIENEWALVSHLSPAQALDDPVTGIGFPSNHRILKDIRSFKDLCRKRMSLDQAWRGRKGRISSKLTPWQPPGPQRTAEPQESWRIKIDPTEDTIIRTLRNPEGGLQVLDFMSHKILWSYPGPRPCAHLEFDQGYAIFDRFPDQDGHFEVMKSHRICSEEELSARSEVRTRGHYISVGKLSCPHPVRAYKFNYPNLIVATWDRFVVTFDIPRMKMIQTFECRKDYSVPSEAARTALEEADLQQERFNYIDHDSEFVFLVGNGNEVLVYDRESGRLLWSLDDYWKIKENQAIELGRNALDPAVFIPQPLCQFTELETTRLVDNYFAGWTLEGYSWSAIHPDPKTNTLVALGRHDILLLRDYKRFFRERKQQLDNYLDSASAYLNLKPPELFVNIQLEEGHTGDTFPTFLEVKNGRAAVVAFTENDDELQGLPNGFLALIDLDPTSSPAGFRFLSSAPYQKESTYDGEFRKLDHCLPLGAGILEDISCLQMNSETIVLAGFGELKGLISYHQGGRQKRKLDMVYLDFNEVAQNLRFGVRSAPVKKDDVDGDDDADQLEDEDEEEEIIQEEWQLH